MSKLIVFLALVACRNPDPPSLADCPSLDCQQAVLKGAWSQSPELAMTQIAALPNAIEQVSLVTYLAESHPEHIEALCPLLPEGYAKQRCLNFSGRPHLLTINLNPADGTDGDSIQPDWTGMETLASPWTSVAIPVPDCAGMPSECVIKEAIHRAGAGDAQQAAGMCAGVFEERYRYECFFSSAEQNFAQDMRSNGPSALALCQGSGPFRKRCLRELLRALGRRTPPADSGSVERWAPIATSISGFRNHLEQSFPEVSRRIVDRAWAEVAWAAWSQAEVLTGTAFDHLPIEAHPHLRASAAQWLHDREPTQSLQAQAEKLVAGLETRNARPGSGEVQIPPTSQTVRNPPPEDPDRPWVHYLGDDWRLVHDDPELDALICVLLAAKRSSPKSYFEPFLEHEDFLVRESVRLAFQ